MCRIYLIPFLIGLAFIRESTVNGLVCKNDPERLIQNLIVYNIENCQNTEIDLGAESARATLTHVKAFKNQISEISDDTFKSATNLTNIDLIQNKIEQISVGAFEDQGKLQFLYLELNKLTRIEVGTFDSLTELKELWMTNNQLTLIEKGLFEQNTKLEQLYLNYNKIIAIESTVFAKLNKIKSLTLRGNVCTNLNYNSSNFDQDFNCFKNYESLFKPHLDQVYQCRSERKMCLNEKMNELTEVGSELSDCQRENTTVHQERDKLSEQLQNCESKECVKLNSDNSQSEFFKTKNILLIVASGFAILLIAFLISIVKICQLSKDNRFLNAKLDKLCEDHVYEKVD
jgi:Leucine-rich repeat (LRR) protein